MKSAVRDPMWWFTVLLSIGALIVSLTRGVNASFIRKATSNPFA